MAKKDWLDRLFDLNALMLSTEHSAEAETCRQKIRKLMDQHGKSFADLPELLDIVRTRRAPRPAPPPPPPGDPIGGDDLFNGLRAVLRDYLTLEDHEYTACALWAMHTLVFSRFMHTPRLILKSPVRDCGKTTALDVMSRFVPYPRKSDNASAAVVFRATDAGDTLLLDEVDNLGLLTDQVFRSALNSGYRRGGSIHRVIKGEVRTYKTFSPILLAGIGTVPLPLARRSLVIKLDRDPEAARTRRQFNCEDPAQVEAFALIKAHLAVWAANINLDLEPPMPEQLTGGQCDNWRPLISIADACGPETGQLAREVAVTMCRGIDDEDFEVLLLRDVRDLFDQQRVDRLPSTVIVENLNLLPHGLWSDWRGKQDTDTPHPITAGIVAKLLAPFRIKPATVWPLHRTAESKSSRGYHRHQFEAVWARYCPAADTPTQPRKIRVLRGD